MTNSRSLLLLALLVTIGYVSRPLAQDQSPEQANRALAQAFETAWNTHQMQALDKIVTDDVDWINVNGGHGKGRDAIVKGHVNVASPRWPAPLGQARYTAARKILVNGTKISVESDNL